MDQLAIVPGVRHVVMATYITVVWVAHQLCNRDSFRK